MGDRYVILRNPNDDEFNSVVATLKQTLKTPWSINVFHHEPSLAEKLVKAQASIKTETPEPTKTKHPRFVPDDQRLTFMRLIVRTIDAMGPVANVSSVIDAVDPHSPMNNSVPRGYAHTSLRALVDNFGYVKRIKDARGNLTLVSLTVDGLKFRDGAKLVTIRQRSLPTPSGRTRPVQPVALGKDVLLDFRSIALSKVFHESRFTATALREFISPWIPKERKHSKSTIANLIRWWVEQGYVVEDGVTESLTAFKKPQKIYKITRSGQIWVMECFPGKIGPPSNFIEPQVVKMPEAASISMPRMQPAQHGCYDH